MASLNATPASLDLVLYSGDGVTIAFTFVDKETDAPWPTTGTWAAQIRATDNSDDVIAAFGVANNEAGGVVTLSLSGEEVSSLGSNAVYDLQQTAPSAEPRTWYRGNIKVTKDVTRV